ncbi:MAG: zinc finger domain-containing protein [Frankiaceae bacterium]
MRCPCSVACPYCSAPAGQACVTRSKGEPADVMHRDRIAAAKAKASR